MAPGVTGVLLTVSADFPAPAANGDSVDIGSETYDVIAVAPDLGGATRLGVRKN